MHKGEYFVEAFVGGKLASGGDGRYFEVKC